MAHCRPLETLFLTIPARIFIDDRAESVESARATGITALQFEGDGQLRRDLNTVL